MRKMSSFSITDLLLESAGYFGTTEYFSGNFDGEAINWSGVKLSLYANKSCDEHAVCFQR